MKGRLLSGVLMLMVMNLDAVAIAQFRREPGDFYEEGRQQLEKEIERMNRKIPDNPLGFEGESLLWKEVRLTGGNFSILMPETPAELTDVLETKLGTFKTKGFVVERKSGRFAIAYSDIPELSVGKEQAIFASVGESLINRVGGELFSERAISLDVYPGRELKIKNENKILIFRLFLVNQRLYILEVIKNQERENIWEISKFFDSFRVLREVTKSY